MSTKSVYSRSWTTRYILYVTGFGEDVNYTCTKLKRFFFTAVFQIQIPNPYNWWWMLNKTLWTNMEVVHGSLKMSTLTLSLSLSLSLWFGYSIISGDQTCHPIYDTVSAVRVYWRDWRNIPAVVFCCCVVYSVCTLIYSTLSFISIFRLFQS